MSFHLIGWDDLSNEIFEIGDSPVRHGIVPYGWIWFNIHGLCLVGGGQVVARLRCDRWWLDPISVQPWIADRGFVLVVSKYAGGTVSRPDAIFANQSASSL
jgi:hypothetical protein